MYIDYILNVPSVYTPFHSYWNMDKIQFIVYFSTKEFLIGTFNFYTMATSSRPLPGFPLSYLMDAFQPRKTLSK